MPETVFRPRGWWPSCASTRRRAGRPVHSFRSWAQVAAAATDARAYKARREACDRAGRRLWPRSGRVRASMATGLVPVRPSVTAGAGGRPGCVDRSTLRRKGGPTSWLQRCQIPRSASMRRPHSSADGRSWCSGPLTGPPLAGNTILADRLAAAVGGACALPRRLDQARERVGAGSYRLFLPVRPGAARRVRGRWSGSLAADGEALVPAVGSFAPASVCILERSVRLERPVIVEGVDALAPRTRPARRTCGPRWRVNARRVLDAGAGPRVSGSWAWEVEAYARGRSVAGELWNRPDRAGRPPGSGRGASLTLT